MRTRILGLVLATVLAGACAADAPKGPEFLTGDVARFYQVFGAAGGHPTAEQLDRDYLAPGSPGLHEFTTLRRVTGTRTAETIAAQPQTYLNARRCLAALPAVKERLATAFARLAMPPSGKSSRCPMRKPSSPRADGNLAPEWNKHAINDVSNRRFRRGGAPPTTGRLK